MNVRGVIRGMVVAGVVLASLATDAAANGPQKSDGSQDGRVSLTGSWMETTTIPGGVPFAGLLTFGADGTLVSSYQGAVVLAGPSAGNYSSGHGAWVHERGRTYSTTIVQLVSGFDGSLLFVNTITQFITLDESRSRYESAVEATFADASGTPLFTLRGTTVGWRIGVERVP